MRLIISNPLSLMVTIFALMLVGCLAADIIQILTGG
jgi:hypothetical protein